MHPVSEHILVEELDEPELILESHLHDALSAANSLELLKSQILNSEQEASMKMTFIQNQLLFFNFLLNACFLCLTINHLVTTAFGMNLIHHLEDDEDAFVQTICGLLVATFVLFCTLTFYFYRSLFNSVNFFF